MMILELIVMMMPLALCIAFAIGGWYGKVIERAHWMDGVKHIITEVAPSHQISYLIEFSVKRSGIKMPDGWYEHLKEEQRRSFVYGNTSISNSAITKKLVDEVDAEDRSRA